MTHRAPTLLVLAAALAAMPSPALAQVGEDPPGDPDFLTGGPAAGSPDPEEGMDFGSDPDAVRTESVSGRVVRRAPAERDAGPAATPPSRATASAAGSRLGIGADALGSGRAGMHLRYRIDPAMGFQLGLSMGVVSATYLNPADAEADASQTIFGLEGLFTLALADFGDSALLGVAGGDLLLTGDTVDTGPAKNENSAMQVGLLLGLRGEWLPADFLSIYGQVGLRMAFGSAENNAIDSSTFRLTLASDALATFGVTFWL